MYFLGKKILGQKALVFFKREVYLVQQLGPNMLIRTNIMSPEAIDLYLS